MAAGNLYDMVGNFTKGVDKIKIFDADGTTPIASLTAASLTSVNMGGGNYLLFTATNDVVVGSDFEIENSDITTV